MIGLLQRVSSASVEIAGCRVAEINHGLLVLIAVQQGDEIAQAERLLERLLNYRVFPDDQGRMNCSLKETRGGLLLVPQFTLAADTKKGNRASFTHAAEPAHGERLFTWLCENARACWHATECGEFGADMQVKLCNDGPVTFWLEVAPKASITG